MLSREDKLYYRKYYYQECWARISTDSVTVRCLICSVRVEVREGASPRPARETESRSKKTCELPDRQEREAFVHRAKVRGKGPRRSRSRSYLIVHRLPRSESTPGELVISYERAVTRIVAGVLCVGPWRPNASTHNSHASAQVAVDDSDVMLHSSQREAAKVGPRFEQPCS